MHCRLALGNYDAPLYLSEASRSELTWWVNNIDSSFKNLVQSNPHLTLTTDASTRGSDAVCGGQKTGGLWNLEEQRFHINYLEMKAVLLGLKSLCGHLHGRRIRDLENCVTKLVRDSKSIYSRNLRDENSDDPKKFWKTVKQIMPGQKNKACYQY